jgi:hypothetical protein
LEIAGLTRFRRRAARLQRDVIALGPEQAVYACLLEALGYKANREPFRRLAEALPLAYLQALPSSTARQAALFGVAGLLPDPSRVALPSESRHLAGRLWDAWWPLGRPAEDLGWTRAGTRPLDSPERRLAAAHQLIEQWQLAPAQFLWQQAAAAQDRTDLRNRLLEGLTVGGEWEQLASFEHRLAQPARLVGDGRMADILVNVALPFIAAHGTRGGDEDRRRLAEETYMALPKLQGNRLLTEAGHRLFVPPSRCRDLLRSACTQQGLLALYHDFCLTLGGECGNCPLSRRDTFEKLKLGG